MTPSSVQPAGTPAERQEPFEDECASCYHGASLHRFTEGGEVCDAPGCDCTEFIQPEYEDDE